MELFTNKKDISFLESEFLTYLLGKYYLNENVVEMENHHCYFTASNSIVLFDGESEEKISVESKNFDSCKEIYTALKDGKKVYELSLNIKTDSTFFDITLRTNPLRMVKINAPKSIVEDPYDRVVERSVYLDFIYKTYDRLLTNFSEDRVTDGWYIFIRKFRDFINNI